MEQVITDGEADLFHETGYLLLRGALAGEELARVQAAMAQLVERGAAGPHAVNADPDYKYAPGHLTGTDVLRRVEYVVDKSQEMRALLGNPFILRSVEKLMGPDLIPTWDSMVIKMPGEGIEVRWHRDAGMACVGDRPIFNVDFYLDPADESNCVWLIPGSHRWSAERADSEIERRSHPFSAEGAVPALMQPGDALLHNILTLHGSPASASPHLRRVVYYEFRTARVEQALGPHTPEYIPLKQRILQQCIEIRRAAGWIPADERPYLYRPPAPFAVPSEPGEVTTYRIPHEAYWRQP